MDVARVVVCDGQPLFRRGLVDALSQEQGIVVVADGPPSAAPDLASAADVLVYDPRADDVDLTAAAAIASRFPSVAMILTSPADGHLDLVAMVRAGFIGQVSRDADAQEFVAAVQVAAAGGSLLDPAVVGRLIREVRGELIAEPPVLTSRELEVLGLVAEGLANREIADRLFISENTVKNHVRSIHEKLRVGSRTEAVAHGLRQGLIRIA